MTDEFSRQLTIMTFENTRLAVPLSDVISIEGTVDVQPLPSDSTALGQLHYRGYHYPVYGLSSGFDKLSDIPEPSTVCVCLQ
ncbi:hypothetical protein [Candidatus Entotheonella palauensis]|uniref:hypothetical protein n=1 Tax=Candidatus Entotheonella palauensis TaxID=93172 RepID=UPI001178C0AF|nr:hypothetical protein [Candidatus Entotheonella palauensis]